jgi:hypothetical protein
MLVPIIRAISKVGIPAAIAKLANTSHPLGSTSHHLAGEV